MAKKVRRGIADRASGFLRDWSIPRQLAGQSLRGKAAETEQSRTLRPRLDQADTRPSLAFPNARLSKPSGPSLTASTLVSGRTPVQEK